MTKLNAWLRPNYLTEYKGDYMASPQAAGSLSITDLVADLQKGRHGNQSRNSGGHHRPLQPQSRRAGAIRPQREHGTGVYAITFTNSSGLYLYGAFEI